MSNLHTELLKQKYFSNQVGKIFLKSEKLHDYGLNILGCSDTVSFVVDGDGVPNIKNIFFCKEKYCPTCAKRKSLRAFANGMRLAEYLGKDYSFIHLVLTIQNCTIDELRNTIKKLNTKSSELFRSSLCKGIFKGILRNLEITVNFDTGLFHPHLHCLVAVNHSYFTSRNYISTKALRHAWADLIGQTDSVVYMKKITEPEKAIAEICKYCVKPFDISESFRAAEYYEKLYFSTKHLRYVQSFGVIREALKKLKIDFEELKENFEDEEIDLDGFDDITEIFGGKEYVFRYDTKAGRYVRFSEVELSFLGE